MPSPRKEKLPRRAPRRVITILFLGMFFLVLFLAGVRVLEPAWWAVPGFLLNTIGQQVPRSTVLGNGAQQNGTTSGGILLPSRRFTVLLLGSDNDKKFAADAVLTQSMILVNVDPTTREIAMVSIPRDFWVPIPNYGNQKIDVAYEVGGIALARATVERLFGLQVDYYAWIGLDGLVKVIDSLGGIDVTVLHPILDEMYPDDLTGSNPYAYFRLYIPAGPQHLDGTTALEYVRSRRGDLQSDFGRSARQQQVLLAIKSMAADPLLIRRIPDLASSLGAAVKTDLSLPQIIQLASLVRGNAPGQIRQEILAAPEFATLGNSPDGTEQIVLPDWPTIHRTLAGLFDIHAPSVDEALAKRAWQEKATIRVLNGVGEANLAGRASGYLAWQGLNVTQTGNASTFNYVRSQVIVRDQNHSATAQVLATTLNAVVSPQPDPDMPTDLSLILGRDHPSLDVPYVH